MKFTMPSCGGCRTCEIACSYHHTGEFNPVVSSFKVTRSEDGYGHDILFPKVVLKGIFPCDGCNGRDEPLCLSVCWEKEELAKILDEFLLRRSEGQAI